MELSTMRYLLIFILCLLGLSAQSVQFQAFTNANTIWVDSNGSDSGNNKGVKGVPEKPFQTIQGANTVANPGDWVIVTGATIQTNNLLKAGVNYDIYPQIIFMETGTSATSGGYGIFDDRSIPTGTTNIIICHDDIKHSARNKHLVETSCISETTMFMGCIVSHKSNTRLWFKGKDVFYGSDYDASYWRLLMRPSTIMLVQKNSYYEFNDIYSFRNQHGWDKPIWTPPTANDQKLSGIQCYSNGCHRLCAMVMSVLTALTLLFHFTRPSC